MSALKSLIPDWRAPATVHALSTTRCGGVSLGAYRSLNLATHVGDNPHHVAANRTRLATAYQLPAAPYWLEQVHSTRVVEASPQHRGAAADASFSRQRQQVCAVLTADCVPILLCSTQGTVVAAAHAGWRGLAGGIIDNTVHALGCPPSELLAWIGPAIGAAAFEVGAEVKAEFCMSDPTADAWFAPTVAGRWRADLIGLARHRLQGLGVGAISGGEWCTYQNADQFFSYRRDGISGRMATLIWID